MATKRRGVGVLRDANWLTARRGRRWCTLLAAMTVVGSVVWLALSHHGLDRLGKPVGTDFLSFWTASQLALAGQPASAYDPTIHGGLQRMLFPNGTFNY
jgi:hypothetical protein